MHHFIQTTLTLSSPREIEGFTEGNGGFFFLFFFLHAYRCCRNCEYCVDHPAILWGTGDDSGGTLLAEAHQNIGTERPIVPQREGWQR